MSQVVRRSKGEPLRPAKVNCRHIHQAAKYPPKKMFWVVMMLKVQVGLLMLRAWWKAINTRQFCRLICFLRCRGTFLMEMAFFSRILLKDIAPCHTSRKMRTFFQKIGLMVLKWPGISPHINPVENLWAIVKRMVQKVRRFKRWLVLLSRSGNMMMNLQNPWWNPCQSEWKCL